MPGGSRSSGLRPGSRRQGPWHNPLRRQRTHLRDVATPLTCTPVAPRTGVLRADGEHEAPGTGGRLRLRSLRLLSGPRAKNQGLNNLVDTARPRTQHARAVRRTCTYAMWVRVCMCASLTRATVLAKLLTARTRAHRTKPAGAGAPACPPPAASAAAAGSLPPTCAWWEACAGLRLG